MLRLPLLLRALLLVPLLAAGIDQLRVAVLCADGAASCLDAAGSGLAGPLGVLILLAYAGLVAAGAAAATRRGAGADGRTPAWRLWAIGSVALAAACAGQAALAATFAGGAVLGDGWLEVLPLCALGGAVVALALRAMPAARALLRRLRPAAPRLRATAQVIAHAAGGPRRAFSPARALVAAGRAPPLTIG